MGFGAELPDPLPLVQNALKLNDVAADSAAQYSLTQETITREFGSDGKPKSTVTKTFEVIPVGGRPYLKLVRRDGQPLPPDEARKEVEKFEAAQNETPDQRRKRFEKYDKGRAAQREMLAELADAFTFHHAGTESIDGHEAWVIESKPRPGYEPKSMRASVLKHMTGKMWIAKNYGNMMKVDVVTTGPVSFGWILAKLGPGTRFVIEQMRLPDGTWVMKRFRMKYDVKIALVKQARGETEQLMWNYRR
jgi:hypothetical protein